MTYLLFALGLVGLFFGGEWLVRGASGIARRYHVPPMVIGLTIVGFGTSTPELLVSVQAALAGVPGIAIGNVVGSNIANILLILGVSAVFGPIAANFRALRGDLAWMLGAALALVPIFWMGTVSRLEGALLFAGILIYIGLALRRVGSAAPQDDAPPPRIGMALLMTVGGLVVLMVGARLLVDSASEIARAFGISEAVIGLTIVAVGTSLPELATSITAALRGHRDIALGNVIGSNVFNILAILGLTAIVQPIPVEVRFLTMDLPVMIAVTLLVVGLILWRNGLGRLAGAGFLALYLGYIVSMTAI